MFTFPEPNTMNTSSDEPFLGWFPVVLMESPDLSPGCHRRGQGLQGPQQGSTPPQVAGHAAAAVFVLTLCLLTDMGQALCFSSDHSDENFHHPAKKNSMVTALQLTD